MAEQKLMRLILQKRGLTQSEAAEKTGWSQQRINFLCSPRCVLFPFRHIKHVASSLGISRADMLKILGDYFQL